MFFLVRMAFWLGLVFVLLPTDKTPENSAQPQIDAVEAVSAAGAAMADMAQFCSRQPAACAVGGQAASVVGARAQAGAKKVYHFITEQTEGEKTGNESEPVKKTHEKKNAGDRQGARKAPDHTGSIPDPDESAPANERMALLRGTLTAQDMDIEWQAPAP